MFVVNSHITIGQLAFDFVMNGSIESSWQTLTDRAEIELPRKIKIFDQPGKLIQDIIKKGDEVTIELGYDGRLETEFVGYVTEVKLGVPIKLRCEDSFYLLKQKKVNKSWRNATLLDIVSDIVPEGMKYEVLDFNIGAYYAKNATAAIILEDLKNRYGMKPFFRDKVLYVGFAYPLDKWKSVKYDFSKNVKAKGKNLEYKRAEDVKFSVKGVSINAAGQKTIVEVGDPEGAERTLHYYNLTQAELKANVERDYKKLQYDGLRGSFDAFARPFAQHGDIAFVIDEDYPEYRGAYFIDKTKVAFGPSKGIERRVYLGSKAANEEILEVA